MKSQAGNAADDTILINISPSPLLSPVIFFFRLVARQLIATTCEQLVSDAGKSA